MERIAVFDTKPYDRRFLEPRLPADVAPTWFDARLRPETVALAAAHRFVCVFVNDDVSAAVLEPLAAGGVELVLLRCAGYNNVDLAAAERLGVSIARVPAYSPEAVAEHAVALLLTLSRKTHRAYNRVREGNFSLTGLVGFNLSGKTAGIVGLGKIGRVLAVILRGFGMRVLATDRFPDDAFAKAHGVEYVTLDRLLAESHVVSLHAPLTPETYHLIDERSIARMRPGAVLVNTSRGGLVSASALIAALKSGHIGGAGLDVYEEESEYFFEDRSDRVIADDVLARLMTFPNVLVTSHQGFLTEEALANIAETTCANLAEFRAGKRGAALTNGVVLARGGTS